MRLQDICNVFVDGDWIESKDQAVGGIRLIQTGNIGEGKYLEKESHAKYISEETFDRLKCTEIFPGDILVSRLPEPVGRACIIPGKEERMITAVDCTICRVNEKLILREYLCYFMQSNVYYTRLLGNVTGTTRKRISRKNLGNVDVDFPSLDNQKNVVNRLNRLVRIIGLRKKEIKLLDNLIKARFVEMFENKTEYDQFRLEEIADIVSGITKGRKTKCGELREVPYMAVSNVKDGYIDWTTVKTILATEDEIIQYKLLPDDVLMTEGGDPDKLGRGAIISLPPKDCIHQNHIFRVRLDETRILPRYFSAYLQSPQAKTYFLRAAKQTTGIASINMRQLRGLPTIVPSIEQQLKYVSFSEQVDKSKVAVLKNYSRGGVLSYDN